mmetsp:Transcript_32116/g.108116  ORF Transcript_32116/g.108116 Transcript_32116/m.108116 type:complete len:202 (+) Transcript_32116:816-1421(+)
MAPTFRLTSPPTVRSPCSARPPQASRPPGARRPCSRPSRWRIRQTRRTWFYKQSSRAAASPRAGRTCFPTKARPRRLTRAWCTSCIRTSRRPYTRWLVGPTRGRRLRKRCGTTASASTARPFESRLHSSTSAFRRPYSKAPWPSATRSSVARRSSTFRRRGCRKVQGCCRASAAWSRETGARRTGACSCGATVPRAKVRQS